MILSEEQYDAAYLEHYGVLGMHWGVRKDNRVPSKLRIGGALALGGAALTSVINTIIARTGGYQLGTVGKVASYGIGIGATSAIIGRKGGSKVPRFLTKPNRDASPVNPAREDHNR